MSSSTEEQRNLGMSEHSHPSDSGFVLSHGQWVFAGKVAAGDFIRELNVREGSNGYFKGSWAELETLVEENFANSEPGTGSVDGDVLLINVPVDRFMSSVVEITDENRDQVEIESKARREGEVPVSRNVIRTMNKVPAKFVQIVVYRADVLAQDSDRTSDAEWEMVAILAKVDEVEPMHPNTMRRNTNRDKGGTFREYTDEQWSEAENYWANHAYIIE